LPGQRGQTTGHIDGGVLRTIIDLNPAERVMRPMRELVLSGCDRGDLQRTGPCACPPE
jgi:hypothetical protein